MVSSGKVAGRVDWDSIACVCNKFPPVSLIDGFRQLVAGLGNRTKNTAKTHTSACARVADVYRPGRWISDEASGRRALRWIGLPQGKIFACGNLVVDVVRGFRFVSRVLPSAQCECVSCLIARKLWRGC